MNRALRFTLLGLAVVVAGCGGDSVSASDVARAASANACTESDYSIESKIFVGGGVTIEQVVYSCIYPGKVIRCVTFRDGMTTDETDTVRLVFENATRHGHPSSKPECLDKPGYRSGDG